MGVHLGTCGGLACAGAPVPATVLDTLEVAVVVCDPHGRLTMLNAAARAFHGLDEQACLDVDPERFWAAFDLLEADGVTLLSPERLPVVRALLEGTVTAYELVVAPHGLPPRRVRCDGRALHGEDGRLTGAVVAMTDVTLELASQRELRRAHEALTRSADALARSEAQFRAAFEDGPVASCWVDDDGVVTRANAATRRLLALSTRGLHGARLVGLVVPADRERLEAHLHAALTGSGRLEPSELRLRRPDGSSVWCELTVTPGSAGGGLVQLADVDARKTRELALEEAAARDELTGLLNRHGLLSVLREQLSDPAGAGIAVVLLDLDDFTTVNDTLGHASGDLVLVEVARRLGGVVRPTDTLARLASDEFVVLCADDGHGAQRVADALVRRLHEGLQAPVVLPTGSYQARASTGVAIARPGEHPTSVLARANGAASVRRGRPASRAVRVRADLRDEPRLSDLVATAVEQDRLSLVYQPVVELATGRVVGTEALVRMVDRRGHLVLPDAFVPVAEAGGAIHELGDWVLRTACAQAAQWKRELPARAEFGMGVNLSPRQLDDPDLLRRLDVALASSGLEPGALVLELTERLLTADSPHTREVLAEVRARGVHLAADDFGTGYSSVAYLADLPLDIIKLDRSWTSRLGRVLVPGGTQTPAGRLAVGVARLAEATGLTVVAEGIETQDEARAVQQYGCALGQGYLYAKPLSPSELTDRLHAQRVGDEVPRPR